MSYQDIRNAREGFVDMGIGDNLIRWEARIIGVSAFIALLVYNYGFVKALAVGLGCIVIVPVLIGLIPIVAWIFGIIFSIGWAFIAYFIGGAILGDSPIAGAVVAVFAFTCSLFMHKVFAGLGYSSVQKHVIDSIDETRNNTENVMNEIYSVSATEQQKIQNGFCSNCGARIKIDGNFCQKCGSRL